MIDYSKHTVLIVDDEIEILKSLNRGLHSEPYQKIFASSGAQALEIFTKEKDISVVITDMRMPGMNGLELLKSIETINPNVVKIVLTGYTQLPQILATVNNVNIYKFMTKPWDLDSELKIFIYEAIEIYESSILEANTLVSSEKKGELYNKMLNDSYEKVDYVLRLYDELIKALNQHHLFTIQALKSSDSKEHLDQVIQQMNDRVYYINKIFEMSRYTLKTFSIFDMKESLDKKIAKLGVEHITIDVLTRNPDKLYYDNYKMISSIVVDLIEILQFNGSGVSKILLKSDTVDEKEYLHFTIMGLNSAKLKNVLEVHDKFVDAIIKVLGGRFTAVEIEDEIRIEIILSLKLKTVFTLD